MLRITIYTKANLAVINQNGIITAESKLSGIRLIGSAIANGYKPRKRKIKGILVYEIREN